MPRATYYVGRACVCDARACGHSLLYEINWLPRPYWFLVHLHVLFFVSSGIVLLSPAYSPRLVAALRRRAAADIAAVFSIPILGNSGVSYFN
jgi:hypothetical protein